MLNDLHWIGTMLNLVLRGWAPSMRMRIRGQSEIEFFADLLQMRTLMSKSSTSTKISLKIEGFLLILQTRTCMPHLSMNGGMQ
jgi:hypothetical protein